MTEAAPDAERAEAEPEDELAASVAQMLARELLGLTRPRLEAEELAAVTQEAAHVRQAYTEWVSRELGVQSPRLDRILRTLLGLTPNQSTRRTPRDAVPERLGPYEILEEIGAGATGKTFRGLHTLLNRPVAVKFLSRLYEARGNVSERFRREAQALAALSHANIVSIYDFGEHEGQLYMVLEFVEGGSVRDLIDRGAPMTIERCASLCRSVLTGLRCAHDHGILHRDIKPDNLLLTSKGEVKIADFGLARHADLAPITQAGAALGSPFYMAPEQCPLPDSDPSKVDARSDLYAVGVVLYEMLAGRVPFLAGSLVELLDAKVDEPPDVRGFRPQVADPLAEFVHRLLSPRPADRYQSAADAIDALEAAVGPETTSSLESTARDPGDTSRGASPSPSRPRERIAATGQPTTLVLRAVDADFPVPLTPGRGVTLGRSSQRADVAIPDHRVSRRHCQLVLDPAGGVFVEDLESANGVVLNGQRTAGRVEVCLGDHLQLGDTVVVVDVEPPRPA